jgi:drug/metabolite transporter (DMT)-like permease
MCAFAANSILCRLGLGKGLIDPASYTAIRMFAGAVALLILCSWPSRRDLKSSGSWLSSFWLFAYAIAFSLAYVRLGVGMGALILFAMVQATMVAVGLNAGERPSEQEWVGLALASIGLVVLVAPGLTAPSPAGALLMAVAGIAWGLYSVRGRRERDPLAATGSNFVRSLPMAALVFAASLGTIHVSPKGALYAALSGALASGCGYVLWYAALRGLSAAGAATVQLSVPGIAAIGAALLLSEQFSLRLGLSLVLILGGIGIGLTNKRAMAPKTSEES